MDFGSVADHMDQIVIASKIGASFLTFLANVGPLVAQLFG